MIFVSLIVSYSLLASAHMYSFCQQPCHTEMGITP
jgi:hypothetical protein